MIQNLKKLISATAFVAMAAGLSATASNASVIQAIDKATPATAANELAQVIAELSAVGVDTTGFKALGKIDESAPRVGGVGTYASESGFGEALSFGVTSVTVDSGELVGVSGDIVDPNFKLEAVLIVDGSYSAIWYDGMFTDMFVTDADGKVKGISHISYFGTMAPVPLPAGGLLIITGLGAFALARRKQRKA